MFRYSHNILPSTVFTLCIDESHSEYIRIQFSFNDEGKLCIKQSDQLKFYNNDELLEFEQVFNQDTIKLLYNSGITFLKGEFFEQRLPTESGYLNKNLISKIISLDCLLKEDLSEKDEANTTKYSFGSNSIFYEIDKLSNIKDDDPHLSNLGSFYHTKPKKCD